MAIEVPSRRIKSVFEEWNLDKYFKAKDMEAIARKKVQRDAICKPSIIHFKGREIGLDDVLKRLKRNGYRSLEDVVRKPRSSVPNTPPEVRCLTPPTMSVISVPSSPVELESSRDLEPQGADLVSRSEVLSNRLLQLANSGSRITSLNPTSQYITPPQDLHVSELLVAAVKSFFQGSLDGRLWMISNNGGAVHRLNDPMYQSQNIAIVAFGNLSSVALGFLRQGFYVEARQFLPRACENAEAVLIERHVQAINVTFDLYFRFKEAGCHQYSMVVLRHFELWHFVSNSIQIHSIAYLPL